MFSSVFGIKLKSKGKTEWDNSLCLAQQQPKVQKSIYILRFNKNFKLLLNIYTHVHSHFMIK